MGKNKRRKKTNKSNTKRSLNERKCVKPTHIFNTFVKETISSFGLSEIDFVTKDNVVVVTSSDDVKVYQKLHTTIFDIRTYEYNLLLTPLNDGVYIYYIGVEKPFRKSGLGKSIMGKLTFLSNKLNTPLYLIPVPIIGDNVGYEVLVNFYKKCGFNRDKTSRYWKYTPKSFEYKLVG